MKIFVLIFCTVFGFGGKFSWDILRLGSVTELNIATLEENMGFGSIINKLNSFMDNIEDPEGTKENLKAFSLNINAIPTQQLQGKIFRSGFK